MFHVPAQLLNTEEEEGVADLGTPPSSSGQPHPQKLINQQPVSVSANMKAAEARKAKVLFGIVIMVTLSNIPRFILSLYEAVKIIPLYYQHDDS